MCLCVCLCPAASNAIGASDREGCGHGEVLQQELYVCLCVCLAASDATRVIHVSVCLSVSSCKFFNKSYTCVCVFV